MEVTLIAAAGLTNVQASTLMGISDQTFKNHFAHIMQKLGAESRHDVVMLAIAYGYITHELVTTAAELRCEGRRLINKLKGEYKMAVGIDKMIEMANRALADFQTAQATIMADRTLSDEGKRQKIEAARQTFAFKVEEARKLATGHLATMEERVAGAAGRVKAKAAEERRRRLGDQVMAMIHLETLRNASTSAFPAIVEGAATDWDREVLLSYALALVAGRPRDKAETIGAEIQLQEFAAAQYPPDLAQAIEDERDLRRAYKQLERLSVDEMRDSPRRLGVQADYLELPIG